MIPLRIYVKGFMSYREEAELLFDGAPLWVLAGDNGAGKSAIFDAITFSLYGKHRGGKHNPQALINQKSDNLIVEFDFSIGGQAYRVMRTLPRRGRATFQAFRYTEAYKPPPAGPNPQPISGTEKKAELKKWVIDTLGLDDKTFAASVLLEQGKSDVMLEADPRIRHAMLSQLVDLSAYIRLAQRADQHYKTHKSEAETYRRQLKGLEMVTQDQIALLNSEIQQKQAQVRKAQNRLEELAAFKVHALQWAQLSAEQKKLEQLLGDAQDLFGQSEEIERNAHRLAELNHVVPIFGRLLEERGRLERTRALIIEHSADVNRWDEQCNRVQGELFDAQQALRDLKNQQEIMQQRQRDEQQTLLDLAPQIADLDVLAGLNSDIDQLDRQIGAYPADLDQQIERTQREVNELNELKAAIPWLDQFAGARGDWQETNIAEENAIAAISELEECLSTTESECATATDDLEESAKLSEETQNRLTRAQTLLEEAQKSVDRFNEVDGQPTCHYCGQPLTPEHLAEERKRLEDQVAATQTQVQRLQGEWRQAAARYQEIERRIAGLDGTIQELRRKIGNARRKLLNAQQQREQSETRGLAALAAMPSVHEARIKPQANATIAACFEAEYPTSADLVTFRTRVTEFPTIEKRLEKLHDRRSEREKLRIKREAISGRQELLDKTYSSSEVKKIRSAERDSKRQLASAKETLSNLHGLIEDAEKALEEAREAVKRANEEKRRTEEQVRDERIRSEELTRTIAQIDSEIPNAWQDTAKSLTESQLASLHEEIAALADAKDKLDSLAQARLQQNPRKQRLAQVQQDMARIPVEAQCPVRDLETEEIDTRNALKQVTEECRQAEHDQQELKAKQERRSELQAALRQATKQERLYKELAALLGRDNLQRYLLQRAEIGIVAYANEVLDQISSGTLKLELRQSQDIAAGKGSAKALDLVAYNSQTGEKPLPVAFLSGSQRFRVAVSLALGIGQYLSHSTQRVELVIIDEGFGSLDRVGRGEMIDALHSLKSALGRLILVSHQEEFANAFSNKYEIVLERERETSRVQLSSD